MNEAEFAIDVEDYRGKRVIFTYKKWREKAIIHAELRNETFLKNIKKAIVNPEEVWQDYSDKKHKRCYYKRYAVDSYVKVVVWIYANPCYVITAFQTNNIKEDIYPELRQLK